MLAWVRSIALSSTPWVEQRTFGDFFFSYGGGEYDSTAADPIQVRYRKLPVKSPLTLDPGLKLDDSVAKRVATPNDSVPDTSGRDFLRDFEQYRPLRAESPR